MNLPYGSFDSSVIKQLGADGKTGPRTDATRSRRFQPVPESHYMARCNRGGIDPGLRSQCRPLPPTCCTLITRR